VDYEIVSDVDHGKITATLKLPTRHPAKAVWLRLRHPTSAPIQRVVVNGKGRKDFDKETITMHDLTGTVVVEAQY
jgi:hypothetical protein